MSIAISGTNGLVGSEIRKTLQLKGYEVHTLTKPDWDITNPVEMAKFFFLHKPKVFINCAAYTDVPKSEIESDKANSVNNLAVGNLALLCASSQTHLIHFSTDFVFDGEASKPYKETDNVNPLNYYGLSKLAGENSIKLNMQNNNCANFTILRLQWVYGNNEKNFFQKILNVAKNNFVSLTSDEYGSPCSAEFISGVVTKLIEKGLDKISGETFHLTHDNSCSRFICGKYFLNKLGFENIGSVNNIYTGDLRRPKYGVMDNTKLQKVIGESLGTWQEDLDNYIQSMK